MLSTLDVAKRLIVKSEGMTRYVYADPNGDATAGPGIFLHNGPPTQADRERYGTRSAPRISEAAYFAMLERALRPREAAVRRHVKVPLNRCEFGALVSLVYNIGEGNFANSTLLRLLNEGKRFKAGVAFAMWNRGDGGILGGLVIRRQRERRLFRRRSSGCGKRVHA